MSVMQAPACACGENMVETRPGDDVFACLNCDFVQLIETVELTPGSYGKRIKTPQDIRYESEMRARTSVWYQG